MTPIVYIKPGCPWCVEVLDYLRREGIEHEVADVTADRDAMRAMIELSGQTLAPTMDWHGEVLADFGVAELVPFLRDRGLA